jgi:hypothetical protein
MPEERGLYKKWKWWAGLYLAQLKGLNREKRWKIKEWFLNLKCKAGGIKKWVFLRDVSKLHRITVFTLKLSHPRWAFQCLDLNSNIIKKRS